MPPLSNKVSGIASAYCLWHLPHSGSHCLQESEQKLTHMRHQNGSRGWNAMQSPKMLRIWASEDRGILSQEEQCLLRREGDLDVLEANKDAWLSGRCLRCLVLFWSGSAEVQSQCPPGLCSQWMGTGAFLKTQLSSLHSCCLCGQVHLSLHSLDCPFSVLVTLRWGFFSDHKVVPKAGSAVGTNPAWTVTPSGVSSLNHPFLCWSWAPRNHILALPFSPDTAAF